MRRCGRDGYNAQRLSFVASFVDPSKEFEMSLFVVTTNRCPVLIAVSLLLVASAVQAQEQDSDPDSPNQPASALAQDDGGHGSADGKSNRLADETSPYLLMHSGNPVDWYPWGDEALVACSVSVDSGCSPTRTVPSVTTSSICRSGLISMLKAVPTAWTM